MHPAIPTTCKCSTSPALVHLLASTMRVWASLSIKRGYMPLKQATVTPSMVSHTPKWQDIVLMPMKQSDILPNSARMSDQPSPNGPPHCHLQHCPLLPLVQRVCCPIRSSLKCTPQQAAHRQHGPLSYQSRLGEPIHHDCIPH
jgi:hypothetical protein